MSLSRLVYYANIVMDTVQFSESCLYDTTDRDHVHLICQQNGLRDITVLDDVRRNSLRIFVYIKCEPDNILLSVFTIDWGAR